MKADIGILWTSVNPVASLRFPSAGFIFLTAETNVILCTDSLSCLLPIVRGKVENLLFSISSKTV